MTEDEELYQYADALDAQAAYEEAQAALLRASSARDRQSAKVIRTLLEENKALKNSQSITTNVTNQFNAPVAQVISGVEQLSVSCPPSPSQTISTLPSQKE